LRTIRTHDTQEVVFLFEQLAQFGGEFPVARQECLTVDRPALFRGGEVLGHDFAQPIPNPGITGRVG
jgi:hypothetical protein